MRFVKDIFVALGGNSRIAEITGEKYPTVSSWLLRCSIPAKHWESLISAAKLQGVSLTFEDMARIARNRLEERAMRAREAREHEVAR